MKSFTYTRAASATEAVEQLAVSGRKARTLAGGMDLLDLLKEGLATPDVLVSLADLSELRGIEHLQDGGAVIGARDTLAELAADPGIEARFPALAHACGKAATPQIRNRATLAGNLLQRPRCWYFRKVEVSCLKKGATCPAEAGDSRYLGILGGGPCHAVHASSPATALVALGATLHVLGVDGMREVPVAELFVSPEVDPTREHLLDREDLITAISLPPPAARSGNAYEKVRHKEAYDWAIAEAAAWVSLSGGVVSGARLVLGGVAPVPWRATAAEDFLLGKAPSSANLTEAAAIALEEAAPLKDNAYKLPIARHVAQLALSGAASRI